MHAHPEPPSTPPLLEEEERSPMSPPLLPPELPAEGAPSYVSTGDGNDGACLDLMNTA